MKQQSFIYGDEGMSRQAQAMGEENGFLFDSLNSF